MHRFYRLLRVSRTTARTRARLDRSQWRRRMARGRGVSQGWAPFGNPATGASARVLPRRIVSGVDPACTMISVWHGSSRCAWGGRRKTNDFCSPGGRRLPAWSSAVARCAIARSTVADLSRCLPRGPTSGWALPRRLPRSGRAVCRGGARIARAGHAAQMAAVERRASRLWRSRSLSVERIRHAARHAVQVRLVELTGRAGGIGLGLERE